MKRWRWTTVVPSTAPSLPVSPGENPKGHRIEDLLVDVAPVQPGRIYRAAMLGEQGVPMKYCSQRQQIGVDAIQSLPQLFARDTQVRVGRRCIVVAV